SLTFGSRNLAMAAGCPTTTRAPPSARTLRTKAAVEDASMVTMIPSFERRWASASRSSRRVGIVRLASTIPSAFSRTAAQNSWWTSHPSMAVSILFILLPFSLGVVPDRGRTTFLYPPSQGTRVVRRRSRPIRLPRAKRKTRTGLAPTRPHRPGKLFIVKPVGGLIHYPPAHPGCAGARGRPSFFPRDCGGIPRGSGACDLPRAGGQISCERASRASHATPGPRSDANRPGRFPDGQCRPALSRSASALGLGENTFPLQLGSDALQSVSH